jgi:hypothetical protein
VMLLHPPRIITRCVHRRSAIVDNAATGQANASKLTSCAPNAKPISASAIVSEHIILTCELTGYPYIYSLSLPYCHSLINPRGLDN